MNSRSSVIPARFRAMLVILILLAGIAEPAFAYTTLAPRPGHKDVEVHFGIEIAAGSANSKFSAIRGGATATHLDYSDDFNGGSVLAMLIPSLRISMNGRYHFDMSLWIYDAASDEILARNVTFKNTLFPTGNRVRANDGAYAFNLDFLYGVIEDHSEGNFRVGGGFVVLGARDELTDITAGGTRRDQALSVILPELVSEVEVALGHPWIRFTARGELAGLDNGYYVAATAGIKMELSDNFDLDFHLRGFACGVQDNNSYAHYNDFVGGGIKFIFRF